MTKRTSQLQKPNPHVAVVIPVHDRKDLLEACLQSLASLDFPVKECEVIICDDCSDDDLESVVTKFRQLIPRLKLLRQKKQRGPAAARNAGFRSSSADIFVCLDSDVICSPRFLRELVGGLEANPAWVAAEAALVPVGGLASPLWDAPTSSNGARYHTAGIAYRRDALFEAGGFDETFKLPACEDVDLAAVLLKLGKIGFVKSAEVYHPRRRITLRTHWVWRKSWKYVTVLAKRYGFLAFPEHQVGPLPRLRVALAAVLTLPVGRLIEGCIYASRSPLGGINACFYALFDLFCGICALPEIFFRHIPRRRNYLLAEPSIGTANLEQSYTDNQ
ncbi:MAG: glycosyltransferase [Syntrophorhabdales bacterium]|jgi:glycosyltransferase involved in cell wall biosynthesis